jgi:hypothetical protein
MSTGNRRPGILEEDFATQFFYPFCIFVITISWPYNINRDLWFSKTPTFFSKKVAWDGDL